MTIKQLTAVALTALVLHACSPPPTTIDGAEAAELAGWMTGTFSSREQALADPDNYFEVRLVMAPIWTERDDGPWLYVEQAVATALDQPYRQRVYHLVSLEEGVRSDVYELPGDPLELAGAWERTDAFAAIIPGDLSLRTGCSIHLSRMSSTSFAGATQGSSCESSLRGASYATSEVTIEPDRLSSWDRGFDVAGDQIWGATEGPYVFDRIPR